MKDKESITLASIVGGGSRKRAAFAFYQLLVLPPLIAGRDGPSDPPPIARRDGPIAPSDLTHSLFSGAEESKHCPGGAVRPVRGRHHLAARLDHLCSVP